MEQLPGECWSRGSQMWYVYIIVEKNFKEDKLIFMAISVLVCITITLHFAQQKLILETTAFKPNENNFKQASVYLHVNPC